jgi:glycosyltransferase involved in cell wall biosynthesis
MPRLHLICNGIFTTSIAGGDIHCLRLARGAAAAGYDLNWFGGHALQEVLHKHQMPGTITLTDAARMGPVDGSALRGQWAMFSDFAKRFRATLKLRDRLQPEDFVYAVSDYWFDVLPVVRCAARKKLMIFHMQAPSFAQVVRRSRPDVDPARLASFHYWLSQNSSLAAFRRCARKRLLYVHPAMRPRLLRRGYRPEELKYSSFGVDAALARQAGPQRKTYDVVWIGRVHRQKGIDDLLATLVYLKARVPDFRAVFIGNLKKDLQPLVEQHGLADCADFSGFVSEEEKFRLFHSSRVFLMTSRFEGSPRVIGEALVCGVPVVAYDVENYRPLFGEFVRYVPCFDGAAFQREAERQVLLLRGGANYLSRLNLDPFCRANAWETLEREFVETLGELEK